MGALYVKVDGAWVPVGGGAEEVFVGPNDPGIVSPYELWYDTDAPAPVSIVGLPGGGLAGQVLSKLTSADFATQWQTIRPSAGNVYGINHYHGALAAHTVLGYGANTNMVTIAMPAMPAGSILDISWMAYVNQGVGGTGSTFITVNVDGASILPTLVVGDRVQLESYSGRGVNVPAPVNKAFNIVLYGVKAANAGTIQCQSGHTTLDVVSYQP